MRRRVIDLHCVPALAAAAILVAAILHNAGSLIAAASPPSTGNPSSKSVLAALLESPHTEMMELVEQAGMLESLELAADRHNLTIFAPKNEFLEIHLDAGLRNFLLQPGNARFLQEFVMFHILPVRITASQWRRARFQTLSSGREEILLDWNKQRQFSVDRSALVDWPDMIVRSDGVVHRIDGILVPKSVSAAYSTARMDRSVAVLPQASPSRDESGPPKLFHVTLPTTKDDLPDSFSSPSPAPSPSPFLGTDGHGRVGDFVEALLAYGGYREFADLLVNLTGMSVEIASLVNEGHALTVLAASDRAINRLTGEHLMDIESILAYQMLPEYHTEESLYALSRRHDRVLFGTLREPSRENRLVAREVDGIVQFSSDSLSSNSSSNSSSTALLMDPNIYTDGLISVQGINAVLIPPRSSDDHPRLGDDSDSFKDKPALRKLGN